MTKVLMEGRNGFRYSRKFASGIGNKEKRFNYYAASFAYFIYKEKIVRVILLLTFIVLIEWSKIK